MNRKYKQRLLREKKAASKLDTILFYVMIVVVITLALIL